MLRCANLSTYLLTYTALASNRSQIFPFRTISRLMLHHYLLF